MSSTSQVHDLSRATRDVLAERRRQQEVEVFGTTRDDRYPEGELPRAAASYALIAAGFTPASVFAGFWPWSARWWKPKGPRENMVRAAALLIAAIEKFDRRWPKG